ncbi:hypothetical protein G7070_07105 [Propioniciclava coleopterorum]|uniref:Homeodomain-like domain-containing protein n=1 Tax=Propioniciclava coleopterorum TaxID=2714937 RepID=A0A6G7YAL3_9ACTN|nr:hypothetical protein G7070_07105 [Propioniciclava coleopterorum]
MSARSGVPDARSGVPDARSGVSDARAARARELHRLAAETEALASRQRAERDRLIRQLRAEDPQHWSYGALASALGCSRELIALVVKRKDA